MNDIVKQLRTTAYGNREMLKAADEIERLHDEVILLTHEIDRLRVQLEECREVKDGYYKAMAEWRGKTLGEEK